MQSLKHATVWAAFFVLVWGSIARSEPITLTSPDNTNTVTGELVYFDGDLYRIETKYGVLTLDAGAVICSGVYCPDLDRFFQSIRITGMEGIEKTVLPALIQAFAQRKGYNTRPMPGPDGSVLFEMSDVSNSRTVGRFQLVPMSTTEAFGDLIDGYSDIVLARREMTDGERTIAEQAHRGDFLSPNRGAVFALDAIVPTVSLKNPLSFVSNPDLERAIAGRITNWAELGGKEAPISISLPKVGSGLRDVVNEKFGLDSEQGLSNVDLSASNEDDNALALQIYSNLNRSQVLMLRGACGYVSKATRRSIKTEDYPLTVPVYLYTPARRLPPLGREFIAFTKSVSAQAVIRRSGLVDQLIEEIEIDSQGTRFLNAIRVIEPDQGVSTARRMIGVLEGKARLSLSFRFEEGSTALDTQSRSNILLLARAIESGRFSERELLFVGFSDGVGSGNANLAISQKRAETVRAAVELLTDRNSLKRVELATDGFGEAMPMACDDSELGRHVNRRVEVWVR